MPTQEQFQQALEESSQQFAQLIAQGNLDAPVASCPGWTLTELAQHMCGTQRWSTHALITGERGEHPQAPAQRNELLAYFNEGMRELLEASRSIDPQRPTWSFGPEPRIAQFWTRRQAHEVTIHLWDAYSSQGQEYEIPEDLAIDGLAEIVEVFFPMRMKRGNVGPLPQTLVLAPNDLTTTFELTTNTENNGPRITIHGPAADLLLLLWGRKSLTELQIEGDATLAKEFLAQGVTP